MTKQQFRILIVLNWLLTITNRIPRFESYY